MVRPKPGRPPWTQLDHVPRRKPRNLPVQGGRPNGGRPALRRMRGL